MSILADHEIERLLESGALVIDPFDEGGKRPGVISYGLSSFGYDLRVARHFKVFTNAHSAVVDPKAFSDKTFLEIETDVCLIPPNSFALATTLEFVRIPRDCIGLVVDKSTYRRCGVLMGATVIEPEWEGNITLEITNATPLPAMIYAGEGIAQMLLLRGDVGCAISYADKKGKYQGQRGLTLPSV